MHLQVVAFARLRARFLLLMLLASLAPILGYGQAKPLPDAARRANLDTQLTAMEQAFLKADFETFADFIHPDVLRVAGGADVLAKKLRKDMEEMSSQGVQVKISHGVPSRIVSVDRELQCTVPQTSDFQMGANTKTVQSTLLAVSTDGGKTWAFLDTAGKDWENVRRLVPNLSREIVLPAPPQK
ncbi:hypothetical protein [Hymenobacter koreensis]|uniref:DUF4440 domain-containing protein n=1 Tax=Hymenobacter koreensis TaxID=1084523 RepID=A0ABP8J165_9BACT